MDLVEMIADVDDISEPACMDKMLIYLEQLQEEDEKFMQLLVSKLHTEEITWEQPWYQQSYCLTRPLKKETNAEHLEQYRTDTISKAENDRIQKNWRKFRRKFDLPDKLISLARWRSKGRSRNPRTPEEQARRFVTAYLARGLERTNYQVFKHIVTYFGGVVKGAYSPMEEKIMEICFLHKPHKAVTYLSTILSREPRGIYKRLQWTYDGRPEKKRLKWTLHLATKFLKLLLQYTEQPLEDLMDAQIDKSVWIKLENDMDQKYVYLRRFWYSSLHVQVFVKADVKLNKLRKKVFKILKSFQYQVWSDIRWKEVVKQFPRGFTHIFLYRTCLPVASRQQNYLKLPLHNIIEYGLKRVKAKMHSNKRLKTLAFDKENNLVVVRYGDDKENNV